MAVDRRFQAKIDSGAKAISYEKSYSRNQERRPIRLEDNKWGENGMG